MRPILAFRHRGGCHALRETTACKPVRRAAQGARLTLVALFGADVPALGALGTLVRLRVQGTADDFPADRLVRLRWLWRAGVGDSVACGACPGGTGR